MRNLIATNGENTPIGRVTDDAFIGAIWRQEEAGNRSDAAMIRRMWKQAKKDGGYRLNVGALALHEIDAHAARYLPGFADQQAVAIFARVVERAVLVKALMLLPDVRRRGPERKTGSRAFRTGMDYGAAYYNGALWDLTFGSTQIEMKAERGVKPRRGKEIAQLERSVDLEAVRPKFETWATPRQFDMSRKDQGYSNIVTAYAWMGFLGAIQAHANQGEHYAQS